MATKTQAAVNAGISDLRAHVLNRQDVPEDLVTVDDWGATFLVRGLTGKQRAKFQDAALKKQGVGAGAQAQIDWTRFWADLLILTVYDPNSKQLVFEQGDRDMLLDKAAAPLEALSAAARRLSGLDDQALPKSEDTNSDD